jgi:hypothetical protein
MKWREVVAAAAPRAKQNASKRAAINRLLKAHPDWSNRRIAEAVHLLIIIDDDLDKDLTPAPSADRHYLGSAYLTALDHV